MPNDPQFDATTFLHLKDFDLLGKPIGHGLAWQVDTVLGDPPPDLPPWTPQPYGRRRPVIALLDSGVRHHDALPVTTPDDPFVLTPWRSPLPTSLSDDADTTEDRLATGHATFIAGLFRRVAPAAQVLSMRVMRDSGKVDNAAVLAALGWLDEELEAGRNVDVVCMAFGRRLDPGDDPADIEKLRDALYSLSRRGVRMVASAGNYRDDLTREVYPAAFATEGFGLVSVGSGTKEQPDEFSCRGDWVTDWRDGDDAHSIMPTKRWAFWDGTSFACAIRAAELADTPE